jgi:hypothetical protein
MRNLILGFAAGFMLGGAVWASGPLILPPPGPSSRPDRQWEQDRGSSLREYFQQRQQEGLFQQEKQDLRNEIDRLNRRPC